MNYSLENEEIIIYLEGKIDSNNYIGFMNELDLVINEHSDKKPILDAGSLNYISSAGLRVLLRLSKSQSEKLKIVNVIPEVYEVFETTGFTQIMDVSKKLREISIDGCEVLGVGAVGTVYRYDEDTIVKVYDSPDSLPMIHNEKKRATQAFLKGIPTAISYDIVKVGDKYGSVFEMLEKSTFNDLMISNPDKKDKILEDYVRFVRKIHSVEMDPGELPEAKAVFSEYLELLKDLLGKELHDRYIQLLSGMKENNHIVHGDIHMKNIMLYNDEPMLIDMDTITVGDPVFDLMGLYITYKLYNEDEPDNTEKFLGISKELCDHIWEKIIHGYFSDADSKKIEMIEKRIRLVADLKFLYLFYIRGFTKPELKDIRAKHTVEDIRKLIYEVESPEIASFI